MVQVPPILVASHTTDHVPGMHSSYEQARPDDHRQGSELFDMTVWNSELTLPTQRIESVVHVVSGMY